MISFLSRIRTPLAHEQEVEKAISAPKRKKKTRTWRKDTIRISSCGGYNNASMLQDDDGIDVEDGVEGIAELFTSSPLLFSVLVSFCPSPPSSS